MRKMYHGMGKYDDEGGRFDIICEPGEVTAYMRYDERSDLGLFELINQLEREKASMIWGAYDLDFEGDDFNVFGADSYGVGDILDAMKKLFTWADDVAIKIPPIEEKRGRALDQAQVLSRITGLTMTEV